MSLDVSLIIENAELQSTGSGIFIREGGQTKEITRAEWDKKNPDREPVIAPQPAETNEVYTANITHNLGRMAAETGIYYHLWRPEEIGIYKAADLIVPLRLGLKTLKDDPKLFKEFNPSNGWGTYEGLVEFVQNYLTACEQWPDADVSVWR